MGEICIFLALSKLDRSGWQEATFFTSSFRGQNFRLTKMIGTFSWKGRSYTRLELQNLCLKVPPSSCTDPSLVFIPTIMPVPQWIPVTVHHSSSTSVPFTASLPDAVGDTEKELMCGSHTINSLRYCYIILHCQILLFYQGRNSTSTSLATSYYCF